MLVTNTFKLEKDAIVGFKLNSGEELIGKVVSFNDKEVEVQQPCQLAQNAQGLGLMPAMMMADHGKPVVYNQSAIAAFYIPDGDFVTAYESSTSGISLPKTQKIIT